MAHHDDNLILDTPGAPIMGATAVPGVFKMVKVDSDGRLITVPSSVVTGALNLRCSEDTSFVTGDSPASIDCNATLGQNAVRYEIINDGPGDFTFAISEDGASFGDECTLSVNEAFVDTDTDADTIRITWVADSAYRVRFR